MLKKMLALLLCTAMLISIAACGAANGDKGAVDTGGAQVLNDENSAFSNVYSETLIPLNVSGSASMSFTLANGRIYYDTYKNLFTENQQVIIMSAELDGSDAKEAWVQPARDPDDESFVSMNISTFNVDESGCIWVVATHSIPDESTAGSFEEVTLITKYGDNNEKLGEANISDIAGSVYIQGMCFDRAGNVYLLTGQEIMVFDGATCAYAFSVQESGYLSGIARSGSGDVVYVIGGQTGSGGYLIKTINYAAKTADAGVNFTTNKFFYSISGGYGEYLFTFSYTDYIYGVRADTLKDEIIVSYINSDIDTQTTGSAAPLENGDFVVRKFSGIATTGYARLSKNDNVVVGEKTVITLGTVNLDNNTKTAILEFNKGSKDARIEIIDYSSYNTATDYSLGTTQLDMDVLAGKAPDILSLAGLDINKYISKGVLEDLTGYLDSDPDVDKSELFPNVLAASETNGKLYHIIPFFTIYAIAGKTSIFGEVDSITSAELAAIADKYPNSDIMYGFTSENWLTMNSYISFGSYVDWSTGECSFDSQEFIDFLEFTKRFPDTFDYGNMFDSSYFENMNSMYREDRTLLMYQQLSSIRDIRTPSEQFAEDVSFVGFPTTEGNGNVIAASADYGISATSKNKQLAWSFISQMLRSDVQIGSGGGGMMGGFGFSSAAMAINKEWFNKTLAEEMLPIEDRDFTNGLELSTAWGPMTYSSLDDVVLSQFPDYEITEQEAAQLRHIVETTTKVSGGNAQIASIVLEEASAFWGGAKSSTEAAQLIQSRVSLYVSENMNG